MDAQRRRPTMLLISVSALCGLLSLGLTSCADESDDEVAETNAGGAEDTEEVVEEPEPEPTQQECLIGTWDFDFDDLQDFYDSFTPDGAKLTPSGQIFLSFDGENYEYDTDFELDLDIGLDAEGVLEGTIGGTYEADDENLTTTQTYHDADLAIYINGSQTEGNAEMEAFLDMFKINNQAYECAGDSLTLELEAGSAGYRSVGLDRVS